MTFRQPPNSTYIFRIFNQVFWHKPNPSNAFSNHPNHPIAWNSLFQSGFKLGISLQPPIGSRNPRCPPLSPLIKSLIDWTPETQQPGHISHLSQHQPTSYYNRIWAHHQFNSITAFGISYTLIRWFLGTVFILPFTSIHSSICFISFSHSLPSRFTFSLFTPMDWIG